MTSQVRCFFAFTPILRAADRAACVEREINDSITLTLPGYLSSLVFKIYNLYDFGLTGHKCPILLTITLTSARK